jgi:hypothetical protein
VGNFSVQQRIPYGPPQQPVRLLLSLSGMRVLVGVRDGREDVAEQHLSAAHVSVEISERHGLTFPAVQLPELRKLSDQVTVSVDDRLRALWRLLTYPSADRLPATLDLTRFGELELSWYDGVSSFDEVLHDDAAQLLLALDAPFVATSEAWERLDLLTGSRPLAGMLRANLDGYVEIETSRPQLVEVAPIPGLFKLDERHFGVPLPYLTALSKVEGFRWAGPRPVLERAPAQLAPVGIELSAHHRRDLHRLIECLAAYQAQVVHWEAGLGRRVFVLAAVETLDAWPALVVTAPAGIWPWLRHCDLLGKSVALAHRHADVRLVTYHDLPRRDDVVIPQTIVFDDIFGPEASTRSAREGIAQLDSLIGAYRLAITSRLPDDLDRQVSAMAALRPGEFAPGTPLPARYPVSPEQRAAQHVAAYVSTRSADAPDTDRTSFKRSSVATVEPSEAQTKELMRLAGHYGSRPTAALLAEMLEVVSAGPASSISPKVPAAVERARRHAAAGERVVVVTRHRRTALLVSASLRGLPGRKVTQVEVGGAVSGDLVVLRFDRELPDLRSFEVAIFVDYPWSLDAIDASVGAASDPDGCGLVVMVHAQGTLDDQIAVIAGKRREEGSILEGTRPLEDDEIAYLLSRR